MTPQEAHEALLEQAMRLLAEYRQTTLSDRDLWMGVFGAAPDSWGWSDIVFTEGDWDKVGVADVSFYDPDNGEPGDREKLGQALVTVADLRAALEVMVERDCRDSCTGKRITLDYDNWDACTSDLILQFVVLGKEVLA